MILLSISFSLKHIDHDSADASLTDDGQLLVVSNMRSGFEVFSIKGSVEAEPEFDVLQDVSAGRPIPVRFIHGGQAFLSGTSHGQVNLWAIDSRLKQPLVMESK